MVARESSPSPAPEPPKARTSLRRRLGCGCLSLLLALVIGGVALEWFLRRNAAHFLGAPAASHGLYLTDSGGQSYGLRPGWTGTQSVDGRTTPIRINRRGTRGPDWSDRKDGQIRILVLGDSLVFGHGVADDEAFPMRLKHRLAAALAADVEVANAGVAGHGTRDLAHAFRRHAQFDPDLVVACTYLGNDFIDDCRRSSATVEGYLVHGAMARVAHTSLRFRLTMRYRTLYLLENLLVQYAPSLAFDRSQLQPTAEEVAAEAGYPPSDQRFAGLFLDRRDEDGLVLEVTRRCRANYTALRDAAGEVPVLHVLLPTWWHLTQAEWESALRRQKLDPADHQRGLAQRRLRTLWADLGLPARDLTPAFAEDPRRDALWLPEDRHLSAAGCEATAGWLIPDVRKILGR